MWPDTLVAMDIVKSKRLISFLESLVKWIYKRYDTILIGSKSFTEKAKSRVNAEKVEYFPNWAEDVFIKGELVEPENKPAFPHGFNIMYTGNIGEAQDFKSVSKAMILLKEKEVNWLIVGGGRWLKKLKAIVKKEGLTDKVKFYGSHPLATMPYFFSQADVMFFSLQNKEIFAKTVPAKLQAYMGAGKPVIGMISGEGSEIIKNAKCGIAVPSGDYKSFADGILKLNAEKADLAKLGQNGLAYYEKSYSKEKRKDQLKRVINS